MLSIFEAWNRPQTRVNRHLGRFLDNPKSKQKLLKRMITQASQATKPRVKNAHLRGVFNIARR